jgi:hypothetical protein
MHSCQTHVGSRANPPYSHAAGMYDSSLALQYECRDRAYHSRHRNVEPCDKLSTCTAVSAHGTALLRLLRPFCGGCSVCAVKGLTAVTLFYDFPNHSGQILAGSYREALPCKLQYSVQFLKTTGTPTLHDIILLHDASMVVRQAMASACSRMAACCSCTLLDAVDTRLLQ